MKTFDGCCGSCIHMNTNDYVNHKDHCFCTYRRQYYNLTETKCKHYEYDPRKDYYDLNRRWYIVSSIFDKLGLSNDYECVSLLQQFRLNVLDKDSRYNEMLKEYDITGPKIAEELMNDPDSVELSKKLIQTFLVRVLDKIKDNNTEEAVSLYLEMVNFLKSIYETKFVETVHIK